jgi:integrase
VWSSIEQIEPAEYRTVLGDEHVEGANAGLLLSQQGVVAVGELVEEVVAAVGDRGSEVGAVRQLEGQDRRGVTGMQPLQLGHCPTFTQVVRRGHLVSASGGYVPTLLRSPQWKAPDAAESVDRRVVPNPDQARRLLAAVRDQGRTGGQLVAFFACMYFAGCRPSKALDLKSTDCVRPEHGWGRLNLSTSDPVAGTAWTDDGRARDRRGLKRRGRQEVRPVPIPPELVAALRRHLRTYGTGPDGRLFRTASGQAVPSSHYARVWRRARVAALTAEEAASPLAGRPYDVRYAAASLWLNAGVAPTEVARRLGHSLAVLLSVYANCIDGREEIANDRIEAALAGSERSGTLGRAGQRRDDEY